MSPFRVFALTCERRNDALPFFSGVKEEDKKNNVAFKRSTLLDDRSREILFVTNQPLLHPAPLSPMCFSLPFLSLSVQRKTRERERERETVPQSRPGKESDFSAPKNRTESSVVLKISNSNVQDFHYVLTKKTTEKELGFVSMGEYTRLKQTSGSKSGSNLISRTEGKS